VAGAVAGVWFGADALPDRWLRATDESGELDELGRALSEGTVGVDSTAASFLSRASTRGTATRVCPRSLGV